jgi:nicotinamide riboside kinase
MNAKVINIVAGPGVGKSVLTAQLFARFKIDGFNIEFVGEFAKELVYKEEFGLLNNQHYVSFKQRDMLKPLESKVDLIITDGSILHGLAYNILHQHNISKLEPTEQKILNYYYEFDNITILLKRNSDYSYQEEGRIQKIEEAKRVDRVLKLILDKNQIEYEEFLNSDDSFEEIVEFIKRSIKGD